MTTYVCDGCLSAWFVDDSENETFVYADLVSCPLCLPKKERKKK